MQVQTDSYPPAEPSPDPATRGEAAYAAWWRSPVFAPALALVLLTLLGGATRFSFLNRPCLWGDEALVYWRTSGTYGQMLDVLQDDGFVPLHYELAWAISRVARPTPFVLRMVPALCGTLLIPAVYWLSRQMLGVRPSLIAAALTTCSAFTFFYSRDAKMYAEAWLFATISLAALLSWMRCGGSTRWLIWVAAGCAAVGFHPTGLLLLAASPLMLLTGRTVRWQQGLLLVAGLLVCAAGPVGYYTQFNRWTKRIDEMGWWASGLNWIDEINAGRDGPDLARFAGTSLGMGWSWPRAADVPLIPHAMVVWPERAAVLLGVLVAAGALPWPRKWRGDHAGVEPPWRITLWLGLLVLVPAYGFYCRSVPEFVSPWAVLTDKIHSEGWLIAAGAVVAAILFALCLCRSTRVATLRAVAVATALAMVLTLAQAVYLLASRLSLDASLVGKPWHSVWVPRYFGVLWAPAALGVAALLSRLPTRTVRFSAVALVLAVNVAFAASRVFAGTEPPADRMAADVAAAQPADAAVRVYVNLRRGAPTPGGGDLFSMPGRYYLQLDQWRQPMSPARFRGSLWDYRYRSDRTTAAVAADVTSFPDVRSIVLWNDGSFASPPSDTIAPPPGWQQVSDERFPVHAYWDWQRLSVYRRRVFRRVGQAAATEDRRRH